MAPGCNAQELSVIELANVAVECAKNAVITHGAYVSDSKLPFNEFLGFANIPSVVVWRSFNDATRPDVLPRQWRRLVAECANTGSSHMVLDDDQGSLDLAVKDGRKELVAKNAKGEQIFSGPIETPEQRKRERGEV